MLKIGSERQFYYVSTIIILALFGITLVQNIIRYSDHSSYSLWTSVLYLCFSMLFFIPFVVLAVRVQKVLLIKFSTYYWTFTVCCAICILFIFYLLSNIVLHSFGYFDHYVDLEYAGYYFGREAFYHLLLLLGTALYIRSTRNKKQTIEVFKGRKTITIPIHLVHWIEADDHYLKFHTETDTFIKRYSISGIAKQLTPDFIRIHRKYLVNKNHILSKEKKQRNEFVVLVSGKRLKVGQSFMPIPW